MTDLRAEWHDHEDPPGYRVVYAYDDNAHVVALVLIRLSDHHEIGRFDSVDALLTAAAGG